MLLFIVLSITMFSLGVLTSRLLRKPSGPERRSTKRRSGQDRREPGSVPPEGVERRDGDRRQVDRRRHFSPWPGISTGAAALVLLLLGSALAYAGNPVGSFFGRDQPSLQGSGWADCATPITWSLDTSRLTPAQARTARTQLTRDFAKWGKASGLTFQYAGEIATVYNDETYTVTSANSPSNRHIYVTFLHDSDSSLLDSRTVGFSEPSKVYPDRKEIVEGFIVLSIDYVTSAAAKSQQSLYLHEMGHALGLAHGTSSSNVMYRLVTTRTDLTPDDIAGVRALTKVCSN